MKDKKCLGSYGSTKQSRYFRYGMLVDLISRIATTIKILEENKDSNTTDNLEERHQKDTIVFQFFFFRY